MVTTHASFSYSTYLTRAVLAILELGHLLDEIISESKSAGPKNPNFSGLFTYPPTSEIPPSCAWTSTPFLFPPPTAIQQAGSKLNIAPKGFCNLRLLEGLLVRLGEHRYEDDPLHRVLLERIASPVFWRRRTSAIRALTVPFCSPQVM